MSRPRIIGGSARGRAIGTPAEGTRPAPSRLREALFDIIAFEPKGLLLDLYAGSGAIGLEAASRGWRAVCVELAPGAAEVIRRNAKTLDLKVEVIQGDALQHAGRFAGQCQVVFAGPPYPADLAAIFAAVLASGAAVPGGLYVLQHPTGFPAPALPAALAGAELRGKRYGSNSLTIVRLPGRSRVAAE